MTGFPSVDVDHRRRRRLDRLGRRRRPAARRPESAGVRARPGLLRPRRQRRHRHRRMPGARLPRPGIVPAAAGIDAGRGGSARGGRGAGRRRRSASIATSAAAGDPARRRPRRWCTRSRRSRSSRASTRARRCWSAGGGAAGFNVVAIAPAARLPPGRHPADRAPRSERERAALISDLRGRDSARRASPRARALRRRRVNGALRGAARTCAERRSRARERSTRRRPIWSCAWRRATPARYGSSRCRCRPAGPARAERTSRRSVAGFHRAARGDLRGARRALAVEIVGWRATAARCRSARAAASSSRLESESTRRGRARRAST